MIIPRQLAPTVGLAHGGVEFLEGSLTRIVKLAIFWRKKNQFLKDLYQLQVQVFGSSIYKIEIENI